MKRCDACGVQVRGQQACPLCQGPLAGVSEQSRLSQRAYPSYGRQRRRVLIWRLIAMLIVLGCAVSILINLLHPGPLTGRVIGCILGGGACALAELLFLQRLHGSAAKIVCDQTILIGVACLAWDGAMGFYGWSLRYVLPFLLSAALVAVQVIRLAARESFSDYGIRVLALSLVCIMFPFAVGLEWPGVVCAITGLISALELCFLELRKLRSELARRLHL